MPKFYAWVNGNPLPPFPFNPFPFPTVGLFYADKNLVVVSELNDEEKMSLKQYVSTYPYRPVIYLDEPSDMSTDMSAYPYSYGKLVELLKDYGIADPKVVPGGFVVPGGVEGVVPALQLAQRFIDSYNALFGRNPPVAYWNFHFNLQIDNFDDFHQNVIKCRDWSIGKQGQLPPDLWAPMILGSFWISNYDPNKEQHAADMMNQAMEFLQNERDIVAVCYYAYEYGFTAPTNGGVFTLNGSGQLLTLVGQPFLYPLVQWLHFARTQGSMPRA